MMRLDAPVCDFGWKPPDFCLSDPDGIEKTLDDIKGENGVLIAFICNHCPYVKACIDDFVADAVKLQAAGIGVAAIMPNDFTTYRADAPDQMSLFAKRHKFTFPYLVDDKQETARAYGAVCTPDFFGFNRDLELQYRGRLDDARMQRSPLARRELLEAMLQVAKTGRGPGEQFPSMGCSIKWRDKNL